MFEVDMTRPAPKPEYDLAYRRILLQLRDNAALVANWVETLEKAPSRLANNWKLMGARAHPDLVAVKRLWDRDANFQTYLKDKLSAHYRPKYIEGLVKLFLA